MKRLIAAVLALGLLAPIGPAIAQDDAAQEGESLMDRLARAAQQDADSQRSGLLGFVENQISSEDRQIRITGIEGVLSSNASIEQITIADSEGIWLVIENAQIDWNQGALLFGRLEINSLTADSIIYARNPVPGEGGGEAPAPEAGGFSVPELPVAVSINEISVPSVQFGEALFGLQSEISLNGSVTLDGGALDTSLEIERLDGPGGTLSLDVAYANESENLDLDLALTEPPDGITANLLNIPDRPEIALNLSGSGPLSDFEAELSFDAGGQRILSGTTALAQADEGLSITSDLSGPLADILPAAYADFFGDDTALTFQALVRDAGGISVPQFRVTGGELSLAGSAETTTDGFLRRLQIDADIASPEGGGVILPVPGADTTVQSAQLTVDYGPEGGENWTANLNIDGFATGQFAADSLTLEASGVAANLDDPATRRVTFNGDGEISGIAADDESVQEALGESIGFGVAGLWEAGQPVELAQLRLEGEALALEMAGVIDGTVFDGDVSLETASLAPFSGLADRDLGGGLTLTADGTLSPLVGGFDLALDGTATDLSIGEPLADPLLAGQTTLSGRVARTEEGLETENFAIENQQVTLTADGTYATGSADFTFEAVLADLGLITDQASGRVTATGTAQGEEGAIALNAEIAIPQGQLQDRPLRDAAITFDGVTQEAGLSGALTGEAFLDGFRIALNTDIAQQEGRLELTDIAFEAPGTTLTGAITRTEAGLFQGNLALDAPNIETAAALALVEATGSANADIALSITDENTQAASVDAQITDLSAQDVTIGSATLQAQITDLFGIPAVDGSLEGTDIAAAGATAETVSMTARNDGQTTTFEGEASLATGTDIALAGSLSALDEGYRVALDALSLTQDEIAARLAEPTALTVAGESVEFDGFTLDIGEGSITATGSAGTSLDIAVTAEALPLSIANTVAPALDISGTASGTAQISGTASNPQAEFEVQAQDVDAAAISGLEIGPLSFIARGRYVDQDLEFDQFDFGVGSGEVNVEGRVSPEALDLDVRLRQIPLAAANAVAPDLGLAGTVTGTAQVTGSPTDPRAQFSLEWSGLNAAAISEFGIAPVALTAQGSYANQTVTLASLSANGASGLSATAQGTVPLSGGGLDVAVDGTLPLSLANQFTAQRGAVVSGTATLDARVTGAISDPQFSGTVSVAGAEYVDPSLSLRLQQITGSASLTGERAVINSLSADLATGGSVSVSGSVALDAPNFTSDLRIALNQARYADGNLLVATVSGNLAITGPVGTAGTLSGAIAIDEANITVPEDFGGGGTTVDVDHVRPPPAVAATIARARAGARQNGDTGPSGPGLALDVSISAPQQIFIRGRGLDAEVGGNLTLTGTVNDIVPVGGFELIRGRLGILGQRIDFESGRVTLVGDLDPFVDLVARTEGEDITVFVTVEGRASDPEITFSSQPMLPQDEVLARLLFQRGVQDLSPLQLAQLAAAAAELVGGGGNTSLVGSIREAAGLDDLDIVTDEEGNAAVRAGSYIQDNVYLGVEAGGATGGRVTIDLDITENLRARGETGTDGETSVGVFYEQDY